jgi:hypothetical protein
MLFKRRDLVSATAHECCIVPYKGAARAFGLAPSVYEPSIPMTQIEAVKNRGDENDDDADDAEACWLAARCMQQNLVQGEWKEQLQRVVQFNKTKILRNCKPSSKLDSQETVFDEALRIQLDQKMPAIDMEPSEETQESFYSSRQEASQQNYGNASWKETETQSKLDPAAKSQESNEFFYDDNDNFIARVADSGQKTDLAATMGLGTTTPLVSNQNHNRRARLLDEENNDLFESKSTQGNLNADGTDAHVAAAWEPSSNHTSSNDNKKASTDLAASFTTTTPAAKDSTPTAQEAMSADDSKLPSASSKAWRTPKNRGTKPQDPSKPIDSPEPFSDDKFLVAKCTRAGMRAVEEPMVAPRTKKVTIMAEAKGSNNTHTSEPIIAVAHVSFAIDKNGTEPPMDDEEDDDDEGRLALETQTNCEYVSRTVQGPTVGSTVKVQARMWPGMNKEGGVGRVTKLHNSNGTVYYDIAYVLGGREKNVDAVFVSVYDSAAEKQRFVKKEETIPADLLQQMIAEGFSVDVTLEAAKEMVTSRSTSKKRKSVDNTKVKQPPRKLRNMGAAIGNQISSIIQKTTKRPRLSKHPQKQPGTPDTVASFPELTDQQKMDDADALYAERWASALLKTSVVHAVQSSLSEHDQEQLKTLCEKTKRGKGKQAIAQLHF